MKELRALILEREHITKEMKKAVEQRELGALRIAIQNAKEFTIKHPQTSFQLLIYLETMETNKKCR